MPDFSLDTIDIISNERYAAGGYPHEEWAFLRREAPVWWTERNVTHPFWPITRHEDIVYLSKHPGRFLNSPRIAVFPRFGPAETGEEVIHHLLTMDPPEHGALRRLTSHRFTPRGLGRMQHDIETITGEVLDEMAGDGGDRTGNLVELLSAPLPLQVLAELLGVPRDMWRQLLQWTTETAGAADPDYQLPGERASQTAERARNAMFGYFAELSEQRRADPKDDIISVLAGATYEDQPLATKTLLSYYFLLVVAGNETTRNAITGGLQALAANPGEWHKLKTQPGLIDPAVEEIVRWVSPVIQFCRTPVADFELRGQKIRAGENMCLFYPSANRDEAGFDAPYEFRVDRKPNRHLAFGIGEHFCLGANLARLELRVVLRHLVERLDEFDLTGPPEYVASSLLSGVKRLPVRYQMHTR